MHRQRTSIVRVLSWALSLQHSKMLTVRLDQLFATTYSVVLTVVAFSQVCCILLSFYSKSYSLDLASWYLFGTCPCTASKGPVTHALVYASASSFCDSEPGVAPAKPRVYGHTHKQGTTPTSRKMRVKVDCGAY
eukprot:scpid110861/ scgid12088/ 